MIKIFSSDRQSFAGEDILLRSGLAIIPEDTELLPCATYLIECLKKMGFPYARLSSKGTGDRIILSLSRSMNETFQVSLKTGSSDIAFEISGNNLASCYYGVYAFLRHTKVNGKVLMTRLKLYRGATKNPHRNLIISLSWMENLIEFPFYSFAKWKNFIEFVSELRFHRIDFMQWGCTIAEPPDTETKTDDEWEMWQDGPRRKGDWPIPESYRGLKYQEGGWRNRCVFEPWLFPISGKTIKNSSLFSVCYPPETTIPLCRWDTGKQKLVHRLWRPPFIKDKKLFRKITGLIHDHGMRTGLFTTPRVPCVKDEKNFESYWKQVIDFFTSQGIDDFLFETEEGPASFEHHRNCKLCQTAFGDIFTGYTRKIARQTRILGELIRKKSKNSKVGWILHVPLHAGYGNPPERRKWLENPNNYIENLHIFKDNAPEDFTLDYVPFPGEKNITHKFLPRVYFDIFGENRIRTTGYTHAWGPTRAFVGLEIYYIDIACSLWEYHPPKQMWRRDEVSKQNTAVLSLKLYGSKRTVSDLARYSINNRRNLYGVKSAVCPLVWDRSCFAIGQQVLKKMLVNALTRKQKSYLPYPRSFYKNALKNVIKAEERLKNVKFSSSVFISEWDFREGFLERAALVKAARWILEFLLVYDSMLVKMANRQNINRTYISKLLTLGHFINDAAVSGQRSSWWPASSRLGGLYDYYVFARFLLCKKEIISSGKIPQK
ncbi:MAG TPA: hypothetical protein PK303_08065 [bacterium]|nr:hypothetical protein [bacterium]HPP09057.1 hypothetical protein [bacterium]